MLLKSVVLKHLKEGKTIEEIARITGARIANVRAHKKRLIHSGEYKARTNGLQWTLDFDQATDLLISSLEKAKLVPSLEERINRLENQRAALENELNVLRSNLSKQQDRRQRYQLAVQQGEIK